MNSAALLTLTGDNEDSPDDVYAGGVADYSERSLVPITYGEAPVITWAKQNPLIVAAVIVAAVIIIKKLKKR
jgi:hypothetical protein